MSFSLLTLVVGALLGGWAMLRCMGNERERRVSELEARLAAEQADAANPPAENVPVAKPSRFGKPSTLGKQPAR